MLNKRMKRFVCTENNEKGISFISVLLTLFIVTLTLPFLVHILANIQVASFHEDLSIQQFFVFIRNEALEARHVYSENDTLFFQLKTDDETAKIELYTNLIRRQVDGRGHEIYLRDVKSFHVQPLPYGSKLTVITLEGVEYEKTIAHYNE